MTSRGFRFIPLAILIVLCSSVAFAARESAPASSSLWSDGKTGLTLSLPVQIALGLTLLTLLPAVVMSVSPFLRITIVLHFLRQALGTQGTPSNQVLIGLALFLTLLIMQPVVLDIYHKGWEPFDSGQATWQQAFQDGTEPLKAFLVRYVREKDV